MITSSRKKIVLVGCTLLLSGVGFYFFMDKVVNFDIDWSVKLSELYCKKSSWVRKSTLPLTSIIRTSVCIIAYGLFHQKFEKTKNLVQGNLAFNVISVTIAEYIFKSYCFSGNKTDFFGIDIFYLETALYHSLLILFVSRIVPFCNSLLSNKKKEQ